MPAAVAAPTRKRPGLSSEFGAGSGVVNGSAVAPTALFSLVIIIPHCTAASCPFTHINTARVTASQHHSVTAHGGSRPPAAPLRPAPAVQPGTAYRPPVGCRCCAVLPPSCRWRWLGSCWPLIAVPARQGRLYLHVAAADAGLGATVAAAAAGLSAAAAQGQAPVLLRLLWGLPLLLPNRRQTGGRTLPEGLRRLAPAPAVPPQPQQRSRPRTLAATAPAAAPRPRCPAAAPLETVVRAGRGGGGCGHARRCELLDPHLLVRLAALPPLLLLMVLLVVLLLSLSCCC